MKKPKWISSTLLFTKVLGRKLNNEGFSIGSYAVTCVKAVGNSFLKFNAASMGKIDGRSGSILELRKKDKNAILQQPFGWILISFQNLWILSSPNLSRERDKNKLTGQWKMSTEIQPLLSKEDLLVAMDNIAKSALPVHRTPCILVNDKAKG